MNSRMILLVCSVLLAACSQQKTEQIATIASAPAVVSAVPVQSGTPIDVPVAQSATSSPASAVAVVETKSQPAAVALSPEPVRIVSAVVATEAKSVKVSNTRTVAAVVPPVVAQPKPPAGLSEADVITLAKKKNCFACHMIEKKLVGPSWNEVAKKYLGDVTAQSKLENKIAKGGSGAWGNMAMPPQLQVNESERALLVRYILNLK